MAGVTSDQRFLGNAKAGLNNINNGLFVNLEDTVTSILDTFVFDSKDTTFLDLRGRKEVNLIMSGSGAAIDYQIIGTTKSFNDPTDLVETDFTTDGITIASGILVNNAAATLIHIDLTTDQALAAPLALVTIEQMKLITAFIIQFNSNGGAPIIKAGSECRVK